MLFAPETSVFAQLSHLFMSQISIRGPRVKSQLGLISTNFCHSIHLFITIICWDQTPPYPIMCSIVLILFTKKLSEDTVSR
jgi:hypothetical protein